MNKLPGIAVVVLYDFVDKLNVSSGKAALDKTFLLANCTVECFVTFSTKTQD